MTGYAQIAANGCEVIARNQHKYAGRLSQRARERVALARLWRALDRLQKREACMAR